MPSPKDPPKVRRTPPPLPKAASRPVPRDTSAPEIIIEETERVAIVAAEPAGGGAKRSAVARKAMTTMDFEDTSSRKREVVVVDLPPPRVPMTSAPEITLSESHIGRETLVEIKQELVRQGFVEPPPGSERYAIAEVLELLTFVIVDRSLQVSATDEEKRRFVEKRLLHRIGPGGMASVERIDLRPADETAVMMRVWCKVPTRTPGR